MFVIGLAITAPPSVAQQLAADRPSFGSTATTVDPGRVMFELGYTFTKDKQVLQHSLGELDIRLGVMDNLELLVGLNSLEVEERSEEIDETWKGPKGGVRVRAVNPDAGSPVPTTGVLVTVVVPVNESNITLLPEARILLDWEFGVAIGVSLLVRRLSSNDKRFTQWGGSLGVGGQVIGPLGWYGEFVVVTPRVLDGKDAGKVGGGPLLFLSDDRP